MLFAVSLNDWYNQLDFLQESVTRDCTAFMPELVVCGSIVVLLLLRLFNALNKVHLGTAAFLLTAVALVVTYGQWYGGCSVLDPRVSLRAQGHRVDGIELFTGLLAFDNFTIFVRFLLLAFAELIICLSMVTGIPDREDSGDFYVLLLGATLGMMIMTSANHLLMVFVGVEMASLPSYALAGYLKGRRQSSEAALKYVVYGSGASGVMLYGISLIAGKFGTAHLPTVAHQFAVTIAHYYETNTGFDVLLMLGVMFLLIGIAFKLAAVPFHFWCPDVFEGASAEVAGFLSVASKGAALALLARIALIMSGLGGPGIPKFADWSGAATYLAPALAFFAALTATFGNLAAYLQTNLKRLLAYSTIAHAGYMMMGLVPMMREGVAAVLFYLVVYLFMNLGAFAMVAFLRNITGSEDLRSFRGLVRRSPFLVCVFAVFLLSLLGLPPLGGFVAKLQIFSVLFNAGNFYKAQGEQFLATTMWTLLVIAGINTVLSAVYYLKVLKVMILESPLEEVEGRESAPLTMPLSAAMYGGLLAVVVFVLGIVFNPLMNASSRGAEPFQEKPEASSTGAKLTEAGGR
jgi:NADH-quinone oxidoreductase subunit N